MQVEHTIAIDAEPGRVWELMTDIERWPEMTPSVRRVALSQPGPLEVGMEARISQPRLGTRTWRVTSVDPGRSFTWESKGLGSYLVASHEVTSTPSGSSVTLRVDSRGWAVTLFGWLLAGTGRRYIELEAQGLKAHAEGTAGDPAT